MTSLHQGTYRPQSYRIWVLAGLMLGAIFATTLWAPASWLAGVLGRVTGSRLLFIEPNGTLWAGSARIAVNGGTGSTDSSSLPGRVAWTLRPTLQGLEAVISAQCCLQSPMTLRVQPAWQGGTLHIAPFKSTLPLTLLIGLGTPWNTIQPSGALTLQSNGLRVNWALGRWTLHGQLLMESQNLEVRLSTLKPLGSYRLNLSGDSDDSLPHISLSTVAGPLQLSGQGQWVGGRLSFNGEASAPPQYEDALSNLLNIVGRRTGARSIITLG